MKLVSLRVENFRSFYGVHEISFSTKKNKPVTLFLGKNGHGKTTLLNAIFWAFTGRTTPRFKTPRQLIHNQAAAEGKTTCSVDLTFSVNEEQKELYRILRIGKNNSDNSELTVWNIIDDGTSKPLDKAYSQVILDKFLPPKLVSWFIFDAEAIDHMKLDGNPGFREDIRRAFGFSQVDVLLKDLAEIESKVSKDINRQVKSADLQELQELIEKLDKTIESNKHELESVQIEIQTVERKAQKNREALRGLPDASKITREMEAEEARLAQVKRTRNSLLSEKLSLLGSSTAPLVLGERLEQLDSTFNTKEHAQKLPAPFGDRLVDDILRSKICICGREILPGSPEEHCVEEKRDTAGTSELNARISKVRVFLTGAQKSRNSFLESYRQKNTEIYQLDSLMHQIEEIIDARSAALKAIDKDNIKKLETERIQIVESLKKLEKASWELDSRLKESSLRRGQYASELRTKQNSADVSKELKTELQKIGLVRDYVIGALREQEASCLEALTSGIELVLEKYLSKHYSVKVDPTTYKMDLYDLNGTYVPNGTGEGVVLNYAFIATMVGMAARKTASEIDWLSEPVVAPLCMDAPFTALDEEYQAGVARNITQQCEQVILFLNTDSWRGTIPDEILPKIGRMYLMKFHASGPRNQKSAKTVVINNKKHDLTLFDAQRDESELEEIPIG
jgi:DNA sulfur modification protein DndD